MSDQPHEAWPEWLSSEHSAIHRALTNEMVRALRHCYGSADAAGMDWTMDGLFSVSASGIMGLLRKSGAPPPAIGTDERLDADRVAREWCAFDDEPVE